MTQRNILLVKLLSIDAFSPILPIVIAYQTNVIGLSVAEAFTLMAIFSGSILIFEVPSGAFSDLLGRKKTLIISSILPAIGSLLFLFANSFWDVAIAQIFWAAGAAFFSGTDSAMLYDSLLALGKEKEHKRHAGHQTSIFMAGGAIGTLLGGFLASYDYHYPVMLAFVLATMRIFIPCFMVEPKRSKPKEGTTMHGHILQTTKWIFSHSKILALLISGGVIFYCIRIYMFSNNPYFELISLPLAFWGVIIAGYQLLGSFLANFAEKIEGFLGERLSYLTILFAQIVAFVCLAIYPSVLMVIVAAILFAFVRSFGDVFLCDIVNKEVPSERRATVFSLSSLHNNLWGVLTIPLVGAFIDNSGLQNTFYLMAITLLTTLVFSLPFVFKKS